MVIGIDTSGLVCSVAAVGDSGLICEFTINHKKTHSEQLLPMLSQALDMAGICVEDADCIAVANGPGSFTGLRIGAATAKGIALATKKPVIGVSTLLALAYNVPFFDGVVVPVMDARRNEVYTAGYSFFPQITEKISPCAIPVSDLVEKLNNINGSVMFVGDGIPVYREIIDETLRTERHYAPAHLSLQRASCVAFLGQILFKSNDHEETFSIQYLRRPQAERERLGL